MLLLKGNRLKALNYPLYTLALQEHRAVNGLIIVKKKQREESTGTLKDEEEFGTLGKDTPRGTHTWGRSVEMRTSTHRREHSPDTA